MADVLVVWRADHAEFLQTKVTLEDPSDRFSAREWVERAKAAEGDQDEVDFKNGFDLLLVIPFPDHFYF